MQVQLRRTRSSARHAPAPPPSRPCVSVYAVVVVDLETHQKRFISHGRGRNKQLPTPMHAKRRRVAWEVSYTRSSFFREPVFLLRSQLAQLLGKHVTRGRTASSAIADVWGQASALVHTRREKTSFRRWLLTSLVNYRLPSVLGLMFDH